MNYVRMKNDEGRVVSVPEDMVNAYQGYKRADADPKPADADEPNQKTENELSASNNEAVKPDAADVRKWAAENGVEVSAKGKIKDEVYEKYAEANKN
jgi:hypothetical protein